MRILVDDIGYVVESMRETLDGAPYYIYGHILEINNRLKTEKRGELKYPLIALVLDTPENHGNGVTAYNSLRILIVEYTSKTDTADQRYDKIFRPTLLPLYENFLRAIKLSGLYMWSGDQLEPPHIKIDRPYYGVESKDKGNTQYIMDDTLDAIELINLKLVSTNKTIC